MRTATIITIGNELLNGTTQDTNSSWMCRQLAGRGGVVHKVTVLPDDVEEIASELERDLGREPSLIVTLGGLGPTSDDLTLEAVARAVDVGIEESAEALAIVDARYKTLEQEGRVTSADSPEARRARRKMAQLPAGASALFNPVGAAPAVVVAHAGTLILSLPGVPAETKAIVLDHAQDVLRESMGVGVFRTRSLRTDTNDESKLAAHIEHTDAEMKETGVYVKSRARRFGKNVGMVITLSRGGEDAAEVEQALDDVQVRLEEELGKGDIRIIEAVDE